MGKFCGRVLGDFGGGNGREKREGVSFGKAGRDWVTGDQGLQSRSETAGNRFFFPFPELGGIGNRQDFPENFAQI